MCTPKKAKPGTVGAARASDCNGRAVRRVSGLSLPLGGRAVKPREKNHSEINHSGLIGELTGVPLLNEILRKKLAKGVDMVCQDGRMLPPFNK